MGEEQYGSSDISIIMSFCFVFRKYNFFECLLLKIIKIGKSEFIRKVTIKQKYLCSLSLNSTKSSDV